MSNNINDKITNIKEERELLIQKTTNDIEKTKISLTNETNTIIASLEKNEKKNIELAKIQELIASLIQDIANSKDETEIIKIRKRLNYYINKIKKELIKRGISETEIKEYEGKVSDIRQNISKYIRFIKRNKNIAEIEQLNNKFGELLEDDVKKLKKMISLEKKYNKKYLNNTNKVKKEKKSISPSDDINRLFNEELEKMMKENNIEPLYSKEDIIDEESLPKVELNPKTEEDSQGFEIFQLDLEEIKRRATDETKLEEYTDYNNITEFLDTKINIYRKRYGIIELQDYDKLIAKNFLIFIKNFSKFIKNKKKINAMKKDNVFFYGGSDLTSFIEYSKQRNSIKNALKSIFSKTSIFHNEGQQLSEQERCIKWIIDTYGEDAIINNRLKRIKL